MTAACTLAELGDRVAADGPAAHHPLLRHLADLVVDVAPGSAAALSDLRSPTVVRERALAVASAALLRSHAPALPARSASRPAA